jgi:uncharacterized membrane protein (UPF0127 family)
LGVPVVAGLLLAVFFYIEDNRPPEGAPAFTHGRMMIRRSDGTTIPFDVELALTPEQAAYGLMYRRSMPKDAGMLFIWPDEQPVTMWMKNTFIPLDMLYVRRDGTIIKIVRQAQPLDTSLLPSGQPIHAVVELNGGEAERRDIILGDKVLSDSLSGSN